MHVRLSKINYRCYAIHALISTVKMIILKNIKKKRITEGENKNKNI